MDFHNFYIVHVFKVEKSIADISTELPCLHDLKNPGQLPGFDRYWWFCLINFWIYSHYSCFRGQGIHCWYFYRATMFWWPLKSRSTSGLTRTRRYWWLCLVDFWNFFTIYVFEVRESFADIPTEPTIFGDLTNSSHLPVQEVFKDTQRFIPWQKCSKFISSHVKDAGRSHDRRFVNLIVISRHAMSFLVMPCQATSCHGMSCPVTSCHFMSPHVTSCHVMSHHVMLHHITSCHVTSCHVKSPGMVTRPTLYCQLTFSTHN